MTVVLITVLVIIADQISKFLVNSNMVLNSPEAISVIPGILNFRYIRNDGAAWGMFDDKRWVFLTLSAVAIVVIIFVLLKYKDSHIMMKIPLALILGGGIGNMIDRIFYTDAFLDGECKLFGQGYRIFDGTVIDFIEAAFIDFPIFNIADCAVTVGTVLLFVYVIFIDGKVSNPAQYDLKNAQEDNSDGGSNE